MIRWLALGGLALAAAVPARAQVVPNLELDNPRLQTVHYEEGLDVLLTIMPDSGVTVMLERGETIQRVTVNNENAFEVRVSPEGNTLLVLPSRSEGNGRMLVETDRRVYPFTLRIGTGLTAAYLVHFTYGDPEPEIVPDANPDEPVRRWSYSLRGDRVVRPQDIRDNGRQTFITYHPEQALPAVFAIGATGEEELVNGHMRGDAFVIDRVYSELVFRIDDERAQARRNSQPDAEG